MAISCRNTGRSFNSVALRYRHPIVRWDGARPPHAGFRRFLLCGPVDDGRVGGQGGGGRSAVLQQLEAVLFLAQQPLGSRKLAELAGLADGTKARTLVRALNRLYDAEGSAFRVEEVAGGLQLLTRARFAPWLRRLHQAPVEVRLSTPAIETLAVVAYRQPVLRVEIEAIRGVQCDEILRQLIERDLVRIAGRSDELGRPLLYGTTRKFLQVFGLRHLDELPRYEKLRMVGLGGDGANIVMAGPDPSDNESNVSNLLHQAEEEPNVKTLTTTRPMEEELAGAHATPLIDPTYEALQDADDDRDIDEDDDDLDDDDYDDDDEEDMVDDEDEEEEEEDLDEDEDEPWEEVDDEDEDLDDEDWDDEDDDWDDDDWEDEEEEEEEEGE